MKYISFLVFLLFTSFANGQGIDFFTGTWEEALEKAKTEGKIIFVDAYAQWCGPCKRMAKTTFKDPKVGDYFNANFINMKLDMEKKESTSFRRKYPVSAFPTLYFIDGKGDVVHKLKGAQQSEQLLKIGKFALSKVDYSADYAKLYEEGNRDPELMYNYVQALNKSNKSSLKVANEYLSTQKDLTSEFNQKFILEAATEADSRIFDWLIKYRSSIEQLSSKETVDAKIEKACHNTITKAVEYESEDLLANAKSAMKKNLPAKAKSFAVMADMTYFKEVGDADNYLKCCTNYAKKTIKNNPSKLHELAKDIQSTFASNTNALLQAEKIAKKAADLKKTDYNYYMTYAALLYKNGKNVEAIKIAKKSLDLATAKEDKRAELGIQQFIQKLQG